MIFLDQIGGLKFEKQTTAILGYLLINSDEFRRQFIRHIDSHFSHSRVPMFGDGIICRTEVGKKRVGFIDLLIEADNCFLAIENKLWAEFQPEQPAKYAEIVKDNSINKFNDDSRYRILVIAPEQRKPETKKHFEEQSFDEPPIFVSWESILGLFDSTKGKSSTRVQVISELLCEFVAQQIGENQKLNIAQSNLIGPDAIITNHYQSDFLYRLKPSFADYLPTKMGFGKGSYAGFYFRFHESHDRHRNWFGFHHSETGTELRFHTKPNQDPPDVENWRKVHWDEERVVDFDRSLGVNFVYDPREWTTDRMAWQATIESVIDVLKSSTDIPDDTVDDDVAPQQGMEA
ncbi:MAG: PD-(D/E)XK nuclease family protein [Planctomycetota bacterium]